MLCHASLSAMTRHAPSCRCLTDRMPPILQAVGADERLRAFFSDDSLSAGLLFRCKDANIGLEAPLGEMCAL